MLLKPEFTLGLGRQAAGRPALKRSSTRHREQELPQFAMAAKSIFQPSSRREMWPP
jgi:hypothetical protein